MKYKPFDAPITTSNHIYLLKLHRDRVQYCTNLDYDMICIPVVCTVYVLYVLYVCMYVCMYYMYVLYTYTSSI